MEMKRFRDIDDDKSCLTLISAFKFFELENLINRFFNLFAGEMSEWLKVHAWKACVGQKPTGSSNLPLSAFFFYQILC